MSTLRLLFLLLAIVLFLVAAYPPTSTRVNLIALGLAFFAGSFVVP